MKISGRNFIEGTISDVHKGSTTAHVHLQIVGGVIITASITNEAVETRKRQEGACADQVFRCDDRR